MLILFNVEPFGTDDEVVEAHAGDLIDHPLLDELAQLKVMSARRSARRALVLRLPQRPVAVIKPLDGCLQREACVEATAARIGQCQLLRLPGMSEDECEFGQKKENFVMLHSSGRGWQNAC